jgi:hypothetical protein
MAYEATKVFAIRKMKTQFTNKNTHILRKDILQKHARSVVWGAENEGRRPEEIFKFSLWNAISWTLGGVLTEFWCSENRLLTRLYLVIFENDVLFRKTDLVIACHLIVDFKSLFNARFPSSLQTCQLRFQVQKLGVNFATKFASTFLRLNYCKQKFIVQVEINNSMESSGPVGYQEGLYFFELVIIIECEHLFTN